jgi:protocatechuate 4,5-dioxygenase alpha chain
MKFPMTEAQREAVMQRAWNTLLELGGVSYALAKLAFTDGKSYQFMASQMVGVPEQEYVNMMMAGGRSVEGWRSKKDRGEV